MQGWQQTIKRGAISGAIAGIATSGAAALRGRAETGSGIAAINATSHVLWGNRAARVQKFSARHSMIGFAINFAAAGFWALIFEKLFGKAVDRRGATAALLGAPLVAGLAYVTDYKLVPPRLTPGYEQRVSQRSLFIIYGVLSAALAAGALVARRRR